MEQLGSARRVRLSCGLTLVVVERRSAPVVTGQLWVDVGSADETEGQQGLAHLHEHMLFKGTERRPAGEIARAIEAAGGEINAWTSYDHTVYYFVLASRFVDLGLDVLADAVQNPRFASEDLEREKKVVLEEISRSRDIPGRYLGELLFSTAFKKHGYGRPILGDPDSLGGVDRKALRAFFTRNYRPENMTLVVVGDVDAARIARKVRGLFPAAGGRARAREKARIAEPGQRKMRVRIELDAIQQAHLGVGWRIPQAASDAVPALDVLATLLGQGESSRLTLHLKRGKNLVNEAYAYAYSPRDPGLFVIGASCPTDKLAEAATQLSFEAAQLANVPVSAAELDKVKTLIESDVLYQRETVEGIARRIGYYQVLMGDPAYGEAYLRRISALTSGDLSAAAAEYLLPGRMTAVALVPEDQAEAVDRERLQSALERGVALASDAAPVESGKTGGAGIHRVKIPAGPVLLVQEDHTNALVSLRAVFLGGTRYEDERGSGLFNFLAALLTRGTTSRSAEEIARELDSMACSLGGFSGRNSVGLRAEMPARAFDKGLSLFADCLRHPGFPDKEIERERDLILEEITSRDDELSSAAFDLFAATLYTRHPYRLSVLGTRRSVASIRRQQLAQAARRFCTPDKMVLSIVGDVDKDHAVEQVRALFAAPARSEESRPPEVPLEPRQESVRAAIKHRPREQAHLVLGFAGTTLSSQDRYPLDVLMAVLTGQGGRLFVELREKRSLAYAVTGFSLEGIEPGFVAVYLGVAPEKAIEARDQVLLQLRRLVEQPITRKELERAKRYLVGTHAISLQKTSARAAALAFNELYGLGHDEHLHYAERILAIGLQDVQRVARKYLSLEAYTLAVVGPRDRLDALDGQGH
ncbi:MAG: insulinase family protein [Deltaproteobacteria bacterium]|nr:insulinase family protein [Deltaproteobacteria bacterium]